MSQRVLLILLVALIVAIGASYMVYLTVSRQGKSSALPVAQVVVAARNLEVGTLLKDADLKLGNWTGPVPKGVAMKKDALIGRGVVFPIFENEPMQEARLAQAGAGGGLAATIPPGMRACAVRVNDVAGVAGFIAPGTRVDVLVAGNPPGSAGNTGTKIKTLLQNIEVLSAGQNIQKDAEGKPVQVPVVNLLVTPEQAELLSLASNEMRVQLVLRNPLDTQIAKAPGNAMGNVFAGEQRPQPTEAPKRVVRRPTPPPPPAPKVETVAQQAPPPPRLIEILNGAKRSEAKFPAKVTEARQ